MSQEQIDSEQESEVILVNIVEELVKEKITELMKTFPMCKCKKCYFNACAIALNSLKPQYVTTTKGALLAQLNSFDKAYEIQIMVECTRAMMMVKESPRH